MFDYAMLTRTLNRTVHGFENVGRVKSWCSVRLFLLILSLKHDVFGMDP